MTEAARKRMSDPASPQIFVSIAAQDVVNRKNQVGFERLHWLLYSNQAADHAKLGRFGLGTARRRHEYEIYAGMDFALKIAHPDAYAGRCPDPVTIHSDSDWDKCFRWGEFKPKGKKGGG